MIIVKNRELSNNAINNSTKQTFMVNYKEKIKNSKLIG